MATLRIEQAFKTKKKKKLATATPVKGIAPAFLKRRQPL